MVEYWPVKSRIDMRKLPVDEWVPHEAKVFRRKEEEVMSSSTTVTVAVDENNEKVKQQLNNIQQENEYNSEEN